MDVDAPVFTLENPFYKSQLDRDLCQNVYKNGQWGCYLHVPLEPVEDIEAVSAFCALEERGDLSSFRWNESSLDPNK